MFAGSSRFVGTAAAITTLLFLHPASSSGQTPQPSRPLAPAASHADRQPAWLADDDPVGRRFVEPPPIPGAPAGAEDLMIDGEPGAMDGLTLDMLLQLACRNNPTLLQARMQVQGTLGAALQAGLWPNPVFNYVGEQIGVDRPGDTDTPGEFQGAIIQQEIVTANKRELSRQKYLQRAQVAEFLAMAQQWRVCNDVRIHFWRTVGREQIIDNRRESVKSAEDGAVTARELWNLGQATRADVRMADVALQEARLTLLQAQNNYEQQFYQLTSLVGIDLAPQPLEGELDAFNTEPLDFEAHVSRLYTESPEVLAARAKYRADQITLQRERVEPIPNITLRGGAGYNFEALETVGVAGISLEVPIWDRNQGTIRQAQVDLIRQQGEIRRTQLRLRQELSMRYRDYLTALQHVTEFREVVLPRARDAYADQLDAYAENRQNWGDVLDAQEVYYDLRHRYLEHLIAVRTNEVLIQGYLLHGGLEAPPNPTPPGHIDANPQPR